MPPKKQPHPSNQYSIPHRPPRPQPSPAPKLLPSNSSSQTKSKRSTASKTNNPIPSTSSQPQGIPKPTFLPEGIDLDFSTLSVPDSPPADKMDLFGYSSQCPSSLGLNDDFTPLESSFHHLDSSFHHLDQRCNESYTRIV
ncbi:hypothetical protein PGTUg99_036878 [Puccinia graminis f. sp. tritici]|uniref:Uncharacterized protein n=1 Tax=Puccinia graminis f. sp. tritici TaxID=56615 RepID=A0A5B0QV79_PUCGR|nr:hypothetical protein PGTUg99_036878 [Puccinia graminis f. sp. tritici]